MRHPAWMMIGSSRPALANPLIDAAFAPWPAGEQPPRSCATIAEILKDPAALEQAVCAWIVLDEPDAPGFYEILALLQDRLTPTLITRPDDLRPLGSTFQNGIVVLPPQTPPAAACGILRALWCQAENLQGLRDEIAMLEAHQGGLCQRINQMDEELRVATRMQKEFLPARLPNLPGVDFGVLFRPAGHVSGDIYDVFRLDEEHVGFFVVDAVGHGVPAALMTVYLKQSLRLKEIYHGKPGASPGPGAGPGVPAGSPGYRIIPPHESLAGLNTDMIRSRAAGIRTATGWYGILNYRSRMLRYARAGHPYPLLLRAGGQVQALESEGGLLGVFPDEEFETATVQLETGHRLLVYSDGLEVAFRSVETRGGPRGSIASQQYREEFKDLAFGPVEGALRRLTAKLDEQAGSLNQIDDMTVICVGIGPLELFTELPDLATQAAGVTVVN